RRHPREPPAQKKRDRGWGGRRMRYPASEKLEIIRTVETSHLPVRRTLDKIGIAKTTFYAWLDRYAAGGFDALEDRNHGRSASGTASPMRSATGLSQKPWRRRN